MIVDENGSLAEVTLAARQLGEEVFKEFRAKLDYLGSYACQDGPDDTICYVAKDGWSDTGLDLSFCWFKKQADGSYTRWMNGGMIYHESEERWGIHT